MQREKFTWNSFGPRKMFRTAGKLFSRLIDEANARVPRHRGHCSYRYPVRFDRIVPRKAISSKRREELPAVGQCFLRRAVRYGVTQAFWKSSAPLARVCESMKLVTQEPESPVTFSTIVAPFTWHRTHLAWLGQRKHMLQAMLEQRRCYSKFPYLTYSSLSKKELRKWLSFGRRFNLVTSAGLFFNRFVYGNPVFLSSQGFLSFMKM